MSAIHSRRDSGSSSSASLNEPSSVSHTRSGLGSSPSSINSSRSCGQSFCNCFTGYFIGIYNCIKTVIVAITTAISNCCMRLFCPSRLRASSTPSPSSHTTPSRRATDEASSSRAPRAPASVASGFRAAMQSLADTARGAVSVVSSAASSALPASPNLSILRAALAEQPRSQQYPWLYVDAEALSKAPPPFDPQECERFLNTQIAAERAGTLEGREHFGIDRLAFPGQTERAELGFVLKDLLIEFDYLIPEPQDPAPLPRDHFASEVRLRRMTREEADERIEAHGREVAAVQAARNTRTSFRRTIQTNIIDFLNNNTDSVPGYRYAEETARSSLKNAKLQARSILFFLRRERVKEAIARARGDDEDDISRRVISRADREEVFNELGTAACVPDRFNRIDKHYNKLKEAADPSIQATSMFLDQMMELKTDILNELFSTNGTFAANEAAREARAAALREGRDPPRYFGNPTHQSNTLNYIRKKVGDVLGINVGDTQREDQYADHFWPELRATGEDCRDSRQILTAFSRTWTPDRVISAMRDRLNNLGYEKVAKLHTYFTAVLRAQRLTQEQIDARMETYIPSDGDDVGRITLAGVEFLALQLGSLKERPGVRPQVARPAVPTATQAAVAAPRVAVQDSTPLASVPSASAATVRAPVPAIGTTPAVTAPAAPRSPQVVATYDALMTNIRAVLTQQNITDEGSREAAFIKSVLTVYLQHLGNTPARDEFQELIENEDEEEAVRQTAARITALAFMLQDDVPNRPLNGLIPSFTPDPEFQFDLITLSGGYASITAAQRIELLNMNPISGEIADGISPAAGVVYARYLDTVDRLIAEGRFRAAAHQAIAQLNDQDDD